MGKKSKIAAGIMLGSLLAFMIAAPIASAQSITMANSNLGDLFVLDRLFNNDKGVLNNNTNLGDLYVLDRLFTNNNILGSNDNLGRLFILNRLFSGGNLFSGSLFNNNSTNSTQ